MPAKTTTKPAQPAAVEDDDEGPIVVRATAAALDEERETLLVIEREEPGDGGEMVVVRDEYTIPRSVRPNFAFAFMRDVYQQGDLYAVGAAMTNLLGESTMNQLADSPFITQDQMDRIMKKVQNKMASAANRLMGNS